MIASMCKGVFFVEATQRTYLITFSQGIPDVMDGYFIHPPLPKA